MKFQYTLFVQESGCVDAEDPLPCPRVQSLATLIAANVASLLPGATRVPEWYFLLVIDSELITASIYTLFEKG